MCVCVCVCIAPGSLLLQCLSRLGPLVDNLDAILLFLIALVRRQLGLQGLLGLLVAMAPAGAALETR